MRWVFCGFHFAVATRFACICGLIQAQPRPRDGPVNVLGYGAKCDGVADDTLTIQNAIDSIRKSGGGVLTFPPRTCRIRTGLVIASGPLTLQGSGMLATKLFLDNSSGAAVTANGGEKKSSGFAMRDMAIVSRGGRRAPGSKANSIYIANFGDYHLENLLLRKGWDAIVIDGAHSGIIQNVSIDAGTDSFGGLNRGIVITNGAIGTTLINISVSSKVPYETGIEIGTTVDTLQMSQVNIDGRVFDYGVRISGLLGGSMRDLPVHEPRFIRIYNLIAEPDPRSGVGVSIDHATDVECYGLYTAFGRNGVVIGAGANLVSLLGGTVQLAGEHGIVLHGGKNVQIIGTAIADNSQAATGQYDGFFVDPGVSSFTIHSIRSGNTMWTGNPNFKGNAQRYGINISRGADMYILTSCDLTGNLSGPLSDSGGPNKIVSENLPAAPESRLQSLPTHLNGQAPGPGGKMRGSQLPQ